MAKARRRIPKLRFTSWRKLVWHVAYRDRETGIPRKHIFNIRDRGREAEARPNGVAEKRNRNGPPPVSGGDREGTDDHGFRFVRLTAT